MSAECPTAAKRRYATRSAADRTAAELTMFSGGVRMRAYQCPCGWWHLTRRQGNRLPAPHTPRRSA